MKRKNEVAKTRDEREAIKLIEKLTNKVQKNLPEFWEHNKQQFKLNKVASQEVLKRAVRENSMEMFNFFWNKAKEQGKELSKDKKFIDDIVVVSTVANNDRYISYLGDEIGYKKVLNDGKTFRVVLEGGNTETFKKLYDKAYQMNLPEVSKGIIIASEKNSVQALKFCIEKEKDKLNTKLVETWQKSVEILIDKGNNEMAKEILENIGEKMPNFQYKNILMSAVRNNANNIVMYCQGKLKNIDKARIHEEMFELAIENDNKEVVEMVGKEIKDRQKIGDALVKKITQKNDDMVYAIAKAANLTKDYVDTMRAELLYRQAYSSIPGKETMAAIKQSRKDTTFEIEKREIEKEREILKAIEESKNVKIQKVKSHGFLRKARNIIKSESKKIMKEIKSVTRGNETKSTLKKLTPEKIQELKEHKELIQVQVVPELLDKLKKDRKSIELENSIKNRYEKEKEPQGTSKKLTAKQISKLKADKGMISIKTEIIKTNKMDDEEINEIKALLNGKTEEKQADKKLNDVKKEKSKEMDI